MTISAAIKCHFTQYGGDSCNLRVGTGTHAIPFVQHHVAIRQRHRVLVVFAADRLPSIRREHTRGSKRKQKQQKQQQHDQSKQEDQEQQVSEE